MKQRRSKLATKVIRAAQAVALIILLIVAVSFMQGCSTIKSVVGNAAEVNDEALKTAEFTICKGASVGSVLRKYDTPEQAKVWQALCLPKVDTILIELSKGK